MLWASENNIPIPQNSAFGSRKQRQECGQMISFVRVGEVSVGTALSFLTDDLRKAVLSRRWYLKMGIKP